MVVSVPQPFPRPRAVLFDLDGTLTRPLLDFEAIRRNAGIAPGRPILEAMLEMAPAQREAANAVLLRHEREAAERSTLNEGAHELLDHLRRRAIPHAIITRNSLDSTRIVLDSHKLAFEVLVTREDEPYKPHPDPVFFALQRLSIPRPVGPSADLWMVGDGEHDIAAANAAGICSIWLSHGQPRPFASVPTFSVKTLPELMCLIA